MSKTITLPKTAKERVEVLNMAVAPSKLARNIRSVEWWIIHYYMEGYRTFSVVNWQNGSVGVGFENSKGAVSFRWEEALAQYQTEVGRFLKTDVRPKTSGDGLSLDAMRKSAVGQAYLNDRTALIDLEAVKSSHMQLLVKYGTVGLGQWTTVGPDGKKMSVLENVPPWQLLSVPDARNLQTMEDLQGVVRHRYVPLDWLKQQERFKAKLSRVNKDDLKVRYVPFGQNLVTGGPGGAGGADIAGAAATSSRRRWNLSEKKKDKKGLSKTSKMQEIVELHEFWGCGENNTTSSHCVWVGDAELEFIDYIDLGIRKESSLNISRYTPIDAFYGRGLMSRIVGINHEVENMLRNLIENVKNMDEFGWVVLPDTLGLNDRSFKKTSKPRRLTYSPDYSMPDAKPFILQPHTTGDFPGRMASLMREGQRSIASQGEIFQGGAPGRTDSGSALGFLYETNAIPLSVPAGEIRQTFRRAYASILQDGRSNYSTSDAITLASVDDTIAGVVIDPVSGEMRLDNNPLPNPWEINIDIRDALPKPLEQRRQDILQMLQLRMIDPLSFAIRNYRENLGFEIDFKAEWETYQKAVYQNIVLFGDGVTPGRYIKRAVVDLPEVCLKALTDFTSKVQFGLASDEVRAAFEEVKTDYEAALKGYPDQMPYPEEAGAMLQQMGGGPGGAGGMEAMLGGMAGG